MTPMSIQTWQFLFRSQYQGGLLGPLPLDSGLCLPSTGKQCGNGFSGIFLSPLHSALGRCFPAVTWVCIPQPNS